MTDSALVAEDAGLDESGAVRDAPLSRRKIIAVAGILLIVAAALAVRAYRLTEPAGGFFGFNEGLYLLRAEAEANRGFFAWLTDPAYPTVFPLYQVTLIMLARVGAASLALARAISIAAGVATVYTTYRLGDLVFSRRAGLAAAAILAVTPGAVLLNHNAQPESLMVCLIVLATYLYVLAARQKRDRLALLAGVVGGLAVLTKPTALVFLLSLAVWETWGRHDLRWLRRPRARLFAGGLTAVGLPWYAWRALMDWGEYASTAGDLGERAQGLAGIGFLDWGSREIVWMLGPLTAIAAVAYLMFGLRRRSAGDKLVLSYVAVVLALFALFHFHSYYMLPLTPFAAMGIGSVVDRIFELRRSIGYAFGTALVATASLCMLLTMTGQKWGRWSPAYLEDAFEKTGTPSTLFVTDAIRGHLGPPIEYYVTDAELRYLPAGVYRPRDLGITYDDTALLMSFELGNPQGERLSADEDLLEDRIRPVFFGYALGQVPPSQHLFANGDWEAERVGPWWRIGWDISRQHSTMALYDPDRL